MTQPALWLVDGPADGQVAGYLYPATASPPWDIVHTTWHAGRFIPLRYTFAGYIYQSGYLHAIRYRHAGRAQPDPDPRVALPEED